MAQQTLQQHRETQQAFEDETFRNLKRKVGEVLKIVITIGAFLLSIGVAYGNLNAKDAEFQNRLHMVEQASKDRDAYLKQDLQEIKDHLYKIEEYLRDGSNRPTNRP